MVRSVLETDDPEVWSSNKQELETLKRGRGDGQGNGAADQVSRALLLSLKSHLCGTLVLASLYLGGVPLCRCTFTLNNSIIILY